MDRHQLADALRTKVQKHEDAENEAAALTTEELAHRLGTDDLMPILNKYQLRSYMAEANRRIQKAEAHVGGND